MRNTKAKKIKKLASKVASKTGITNYKPLYRNMKKKYFNWSTYDIDRQIAILG